jgi:phosphate transport system protein
VSKHLERDLESLEAKLLSMSAAVEAMIDKAWQSIVDKNGRLANEVIASDDAINEQEVHIEEDCLKILALHQPVAIDLRRTATILKVNNDLERIADLAVNIAERSQRLKSVHDFVIPTTLNTMAESARRMVRDALNSLVSLDADDALEVGADDDEVDRCHAEVVDELYRTMCDRRESIAPAMHCLSVARQVERIADHATNIAEEVVYLVRGDIARHRGREFRREERGFVPTAD